MTYRSARTIARHQQSPPRWRGEALVLSPWFWTSQSGRWSFQTMYRVVLSALALGARVRHLWCLVVADRHPKAESEHSLATPE